jgi:hypothetical protein
LGNAHPIGLSVPAPVSEEPTPTAAHYIAL